MRAVDPDKSGKRRILLVDDDDGIRRVLNRVLAEEGYDVLPAADGPEAVALAGRKRVDLVLLDLNLPGKSGWETFERLMTANPMLPVIVITARPNQLFTAVASGVGALMEKPLDIPRLFRTMRDLLDEEPAARRARVAGKASEFHYQPPLR